MLRNSVDILAEGIADERLQSTAIESEKKYIFHSLNLKKYSFFVYLKYTQTMTTIPTRFYDFQMTSPQKNDAADQNFDYMFKLLIIGNSAVGKTSFLFRYDSKYMF